jgi:hypothetical protein
MQTANGFSCVRTYRVANRYDTKDLALAIGMPLMSNNYDRLADENGIPQFQLLQRSVFLREVQITYLHELGLYFGWNDEQIANVGLA